MTLRSAIRHFCLQMEADGKSPLTIRVYRGELERLATLNRSKAAIRSLFDYLVLRGTLRHSPARLLKNGRTDRPIPKALTDDEVKRFEHALRIAAKESAIGRRDQVLFTLLLKSGMRLSEALTIDAEQCHPSRSSILIRGKNGRSRQVFLVDPFRRLLREYLKTEDLKSGPVFRTRSGRLTPRQVQYRFRRLVELTGIQSCATVHSLRHSFATALRRRTGDLRIVQAALGHRSLSATEVYAEVDRAEVHDAIGSLGTT